MRFRPTEEQAEAISHLDGLLSITAGAGSGKTRVLAERLVASLEDASWPPGRTPVQLDEALVVTFTEKAAGEVAERVRRVLLEHGLVSQARRIDDAWISTIHGLCQRLLRTHALEAGLDPAFRVIPEVDAGLLREAVYEEVLRASLEKPAIAELVATFGVGGVEDHVGKLHDSIRAMGADIEDLVAEEAVDPGELLGEALVALRDWKRRLDVEQPTSTLSTVIDSIGDALERLDRLDPACLGDRDLAREILRAVHGVRLLRSVGAAAKETVEAIALERRGLLDRGVRAVAAPLETSLLELTASFARGYGSAKRDRGVLDFEDLQLLALRSLEDGGDRSRRYREQFRLVMVDEFQDTNEVQTAIADLLSGRGLCTVGDERQSIYAFRYADVEVYRAHTARMLGSGGRRVTLTVNFRSHPAILAFVNAVFSHPLLFGPGFPPLRHGRDETESASAVLAGPRVDLVMVQRSREGASAAREVEAQTVASRLRELADAGVPQGSMVVLLRALTHADEYASALRRQGLEVVAAAGGSFFSRPEVAAARAFLAAVANPLDDEALALVLASLAGLSDDGLLRLREASGGRALWAAAEAASLAGPDDEGLGRARAAILHARLRLGRDPLGSLLLRAYEDLDADLRLLAEGREGRRAYANVLKLARLADEFEAAGGSGLGAFLEHLTHKERLADREGPAAMVDERVAAVRIMTVHGAKGLEFPVVALPELGRDLVSDRGGLVIEKEGKGARFALSLPDDGCGTKAEERRSAWASEARQRARERDIEEEKRLLYVACTRAQDLLILSGVTDLSKPGGDRPIDWIRSALDLDASLEKGDSKGASIDLAGAPPARLRVLDAAAPRPQPVAPCPEPVRPQQAAAPTPATARPEREKAAVASPAPQVSYSAIREYRTCPLRYFASRVARLGDASPPGSRPARRVGDATHAALRLLGPRGEAPSRGRLDAIARRFGLDPQEAGRLRDAVEAVAASPACRAAHEPGPPAREVPFAVPVGASTLVGRLDLLARTEGTTRIIDYKTGQDALGSASEDGDHRLQADCYAYVALATGSRVAEVTFVALEALEDGSPRELTFRYGADDSPTLTERLEALVARLAEGPFDPLPAYDRDACPECPAARNVCPVEVPPPRSS